MGPFPMQLHTRRCSVEVPLLCDLVTSAVKMTGPSPVLQEVIRKLLLLDRRARSAATETASEQSLGSLASSLKVFVLQRSPQSALHEETREILLALCEESLRWVLNITLGKAHQGVSTTGFISSCFRLLAQS